MRRLIWILLLLVPSVAFGAGPTIPDITVTGTGTFGALSVSGLATLTGGGTLGGTWAGTLQQSGTRTWSSGFPGTGNLGLYQSVSMSGTPTAGFAGPEGTSAPFNLINWNESSVSAGYPLSALEIQHNYCSGSVSGTTCDGGRNTLLVTGQLLGVVGTDNTNFVVAQIFSIDGGNVSGATSGSPLGDFFGFSVNQQIASGSYAYGMTGSEFDYTQKAGSVVNYQEFMKFVVFTPSGTHAAVNSAFLRFENAGAGYDHLDYGLYFGDPQVSGGGFPISSTGTAIYLGNGTLATAIDGSSLTTTTFIKGPNNFAVDNSNSVHTNALVPPSGNQLTIYNASNAPIANFKADVSDVNYVELHSTATGTDAYVLGTGTGAGSLGLGFEAGSAAGLFSFFNSSNQVGFIIANTSGQVNHIQVAGALTGSGPVLSATGTDTNVDLGLATKGTGVVRINGTATVTGTTCTQWTDGLCTHL